MLTFLSQDPEISDVLPRIMAVLQDRLRACYMRIMAENPQDPLVVHIAPLSRRVRALQNPNV